MKTASSVLKMSSNVQIVVKTFVRVPKQHAEEQSGEVARSSVLNLANFSLFPARVDADLAREQWLVFFDQVQK